MRNTKLKLTTLAVAAALGLSGCLQGEDTATNPLAKPDVVTSGVITGFGSVFINGVEYETDTAAFNIDDIAGAESQLKVGMYITLQGSVNADGSTGTAASIQFDHDVDGMVQANNIAVDGTLNIMGQIVTVDANTRFESHVATILSPADIGINNIVEVSGYSAGNGNIYATRIEVKSEAAIAGEEVEMKGIVSNLSASTFTIGAMTVDFTSAQMDGFSDIALADGMYVKVKSIDGLNQNGALVASKVKLKDAEGKHEKRAENEEMEVEGVITAIPDNTGTFEVNGQKAILAADVEIEGGQLADLLSNTKVAIEGKYDANGNFIIEQIKLHEEGDLKFSGYVEATNVANNTITLFGKDIKVNNFTVVEDERDESGNTPVRYFGVDDISVGDSVEVKFYEDGTTGELVATELSRDDDQYAGLASRMVELEGVVDSLDSNGNPVISGISVDLGTANTGLTVAVGDELELKGTFEGGVFTVVEVSM